ncbi:hypothetical protein BDP55DRAFT_55323 [Colletotrichum godetiae]|uniref:Uncharacterized protein n=1 Tax=Colletotrichum godetiae TaxID=1209918 RepID=A0AAJ0EKW0_9PEZI|nr:uncharacterized protein BDP55DRAFT_55323 [Colletotrichum godetiae]KAK1656880.1 hypothetical protein BDP55DRAFT_55323 [Colletotrichum godetiae]
MQNRCSASSRMSIRRKTRKCRNRCSASSRMSIRRKTRKCRNRCPASLEIHQRHRYMAASTQGQRHLSDGAGLEAQPTKKTPESKRVKPARCAMTSESHCTPLENKHSCISNNRWVSVVAGV